MELPSKLEQDLVKRLRRIEGQVRGVQQMVIDGRECRDVVAQISAAGTALDQVGFKLLAAGIQSCLNDPEAAEKNGFSLPEVERLFLKLA